jgi:hypothetical protein
MKYIFPPLLGFILAILFLSLLIIGCQKEGSAGNSPDSNESMQ